MSAGIYMIDGKLAYSINLEKKLKRRKNAIIIDTYIGNAEGAELERELQLLLDKHNEITKSKNPIIKDEQPLLYNWKNKYTNETISSIYPHLRNIPNINIEDWESIG